MTEYRKCKRCGNENWTEVYSCRYCGIIYCDACKPKSDCPKSSVDKESLQEHWDETIGYVSGFCDICHRSMYGNERFNIGEYNILSGHENCLSDFYETKEGEEWLENEKKEKEEEPKKAERLRIETERIRIENEKKLVAFEERIRKQEEEEKRKEEEERRINHQKYLNEVKKTKFRKVIQFIILPFSIILGLQIIFKINLFPFPVKMTWMLIILGIEYIIYLIVTLFLENKFDIEFSYDSNIFKCIILNSICFMIIIFAIRFYFSRQ